MGDCVGLLEMCGKHFDAMLKVDVEHITYEISLQVEVKRNKPERRRECATSPEVWPITVASKCVCVALLKSYFRWHRVASSVCVCVCVRSACAGNEIKFVRRNFDYSLIGKWNGTDRQRNFA